MKLFLNQENYFLTENGTDLSIPIITGKENVNAWYCDPVIIEPVIGPNFIGDVNQGGSVNFRNITINPHGNGTHTECVGHISKEPYTINTCLKEFHFYGKIISITPKKWRNEEFNQDDLIIDKEDIKNAIGKWNNEKVLIIRTINHAEPKNTFQYSNTNPAYLTKNAMLYINSLGIDHLMVDMPSVDREKDNGALVCHKTFWNYPESPQLHKTISELLFIPKQLVDDTYLIQIQIISIESDASPSKILAHKIYKV